MKVTIISPIFPSPIHYIAEVARICYGKEFEGIEKDDLKTVINLLNRGHHTPFESIYIEWYLQNISRAAATQIVRHRLTSPLQQSQRYVNYKDNDEFWDNMVIPDLEYIKDEYDRKAAIFAIEQHIKNTRSDYNYLIKCGARPEDARCILPQCSPTSMKLGMNLREFLFNFLPLRASKHAQEEVRCLSLNMLAELRLRYQDDKSFDYFMDAYKDWLLKQNRPEWK
jgi:thymidylate synthase (FAD)